MSTAAKGYAVHAEKQALAPFTFGRRDLRPNDIRIEILYCGVCHSDLHTARGDWEAVIYPNRIDMASLKQSA
jgi:alcohol dehydrogenase (NADP+)